MNERQKQKWQKRRMIGKSKYILLYGMLGVGVIATLLITLLEYITTQSIIYQWVIIRLVLFGVCGYIWGHFKWQSMESKFEQKDSK